MTRLIALAILLSWMVCSSTLAQETKTLTLGGQKITLTVSQSEIFVRLPSQQNQLEDPRGRAKELGNKTCVAQVAMLNSGNETLTNSMLQQVVISKALGRLGNLSGGAFIPRAIGLGSTRIQTLLDKEDGVAQVVYNYKGRRLISVGSISMRFKEEPKAEVVASIVERFGLTEIGRPKYAPNVVRFLVGNQGDEAIAASEMIAGLDDVLWAEPDFAVEVMRCGDFQPHDTHFAKQWHLNKLKMPTAWGIHKTGSTVVVAVLDDGVDLSHPDLSGKLVPGFDFVDQDDTPQPDSSSSHGTACAGLIAAILDNGLGVSGIAPSAQIMPIRISDASDFVVDADIADAIEFAGSHGARILSCSWGGGPATSKITDAIDTVTDGGALVFAASGNATPPADVFFPARYDKCVAVGATTQNDTLWNYSCFGPQNEVDIVAPSGNVNLQGDIWTIDNQGVNGYNQGGATGEESTGDYCGKFGGTSAASPIAAGVAAWIWSGVPHLTNQQLRASMESTAIKVDAVFGSYGADGKSKFYGFGRIDPLSAWNTASSITVAANGAADRQKMNEIIYKVGDKTVVLQPDLQWLHVKPKAGDESSGAISGIVNNIEGSELSVLKSKGEVTYLILASNPSKMFNLKESLSKWSIESNYGYRATSAPESLVLLDGSVSVRAKDEESAKVIWNFAEKNHLKIEGQGVRLTLRPSDQSQINNVVALMKSVEATEAVAWVEPNFIRQIKK